MKIVIFTVFIYYTILSNSLKLKSQFRNLNYNFGKFAQTLNSQSKNKFLKKDVKSLLNNPIDVENPNFELTRSKIDTEYHDLIKMFNNDAILLQKYESLKTSSPIKNMKETKNEKADSKVVSSIPAIEKELENKGSGSLGVIFTEKLETLKDIFKELKSDK